MGNINFPFIIALVVLLSYWKVIVWGGYCIDDEDIAKLTEPVPKNRWQRIYFQIKGKRYFNTQEEYLISILIHLINCELVYFAFGHSTASFFTALLFAVNPVGTQASTWLSGKGYAISTIFILLAWWLFPPLCLLSPFFASNGFFSPVLFLRKGWWWVFMVPLLLKIAKDERWVMKYRISHATGRGKTINWKKGIIAGKCLAYYFSLILFPVRLGIYHTFMYTYSLSEKDNEYWERPDRYFWFGCVLLAVLAYGWCFNYSEIVFGLFWFVILIAQWTNVISLNQSVGERYTYAAMIGLMYSVVNCLTLIPNTAIRYSLFTAIFIAYWVRLQFTLPAYYSMEHMVDYNRWNFPDLYVVWTWKGQLEKRRSSFFTALEYWFRGWRMRPIDFRLNNNIAVMLTDLGRLDDAEAFLKNAEKNMIPEQKVIAGAFIEKERGRIAQAREAMMKQKIGSRIIIPGR